MVAILTAQTSQQLPFKRVLKFALRMIITKVGLNVRLNCSLK